MKTENFSRNSRREHSQAGTKSTLQTLLLLLALICSVLLAFAVLTVLSQHAMDRASSSKDLLRLSGNQAVLPMIQAPFPSGSPDSLLKISKNPPGSFPAEDPPAQTFIDVPPDHWAFAEIEALYAAGFTRGCSTDPLRYCPDIGLTRGEMSVFTLRGVHNADFLPVQPSQQMFADTPLAHWAVKWATRMYEDGYSAGCSASPLNYCTDSAHTREEAAVFAVRLLHGSNYMPMGPTGLFEDVDPAGWSARWIEAAYHDELLDPCQTSPQMLFCPKDILTRDWAAVMLTRALGLPPVPPDPTPTQAPTITASPAPPTQAPTITASPAPPTQAPTITASPAPPTQAPTITASPVPPTTEPPSSSRAPVAVITVLHDTSNRMNDFSNTTLIDTQTIRFRIDDSYDPNGVADLQNGGSFYVRLHSRRFLGCGIVWRLPELSYQEAQGRIFEVTLDDIGYYSIELTVTDRSGLEGDTRFYFFTKVSPQGLGPEPAGNHAPMPVLSIRNVSGGSGSHGDPLRVQGSTIAFNLLSSTDPDGHADIRQGLFAYEINADGMHPLHQGSYSYSYMEQTDFTFDLQQIGSETSFYIDAYAIDRWGRVTVQRYHCSRVQ